MTVLWRSAMNEHEITAPKNYLHHFWRIARLISSEKAKGSSSAVLVRAHRLDCQLT